LIEEKYHQGVGVMTQIIDHHGNALKVLETVAVSV